MNSLDQLASVNGAEKEMREFASQVNEIQNHHSEAQANNMSFGVMPVFKIESTVQESSNNTDDKNSSQKEKSSKLNSIEESNRHDEEERR